MKKVILGGLAALAVGLTACSSSEADAPIVTGSNGKSPEVVVLVDCGEDGVAGVRVKYGLTDDDVLIGRNPITRSAGGLKTFSSNYGTADSDYSDRDLTVTTSPTEGTCKTTLTDYNNGKVISERETAGKVTLKAVIRGGAK